MFKEIKDIVETQNTRAGWIFDIVLQSLILISLIMFSLDTVPEFDQKYHSFFKISEAIIVIIFSIEYILRIIVADSKLRFIFSLTGMIDLLAIIPFYITHGTLDLRVLRLFRLLRVFRALKLIRYSNALRRLRIAFETVKSELTVFLFFTFLMLYLSATGIYYFEHELQPEVFKSVFHCMWWALATLTTVGYGDMVPLTLGGRFFTFIILMIGLGVVSVPSALFATALHKLHKEE